MSAFGSLVVAPARKSRPSPFRSGETHATRLATKNDRVTLVFEAIGDDKVRVGCSSWDDSKVILAEEALWVVALGKTLYMTRSDAELFDEQCLARFLSIQSNPNETKRPTLLSARRSSPSASPAC